MSTNQHLPKFNAVILDMDGLAIDSEPSFLFAWKQAAIEFGTHLDDNLALSLLGRHAEEVESALKQAIGEKFDGPHFRLLSARFWREYVESKGIPPLPGLASLLELLISKRIPYALATNSDSRSASECLRLSGLENDFPIVVTRNQVSAGKPAPDVFLLAARLLGVAASECLVLEDSATGLLAASRAGMTPLLVNAQPDGESQQLAVMSFLSLHEVAKAIVANR